MITQIFKRGSWLSASLLLPIGKTVVQCFQAATNSRHRKRAGVPKACLFKFRQRRCSSTVMICLCLPLHWAQTVAASFGDVTPRCPDSIAARLSSGTSGASPSRDCIAFMMVHSARTNSASNWLHTSNASFPAHSEDFLVARKTVEKRVRAESHIDVLKRYLNASIMPRGLRIKLHPAASELCSAN